MSPAAAASSCAAARGAVPPCPSPALSPIIRSCDARRRESLASPGAPTSHEAASAVSVRAACPAVGVPAPAARRR
eukprot:5262384-Pleurochrysis_carterae.AAC.1